jgi:hypothetical protein
MPRTAKERDDATAIVGAANVDRKAKHKSNSGKLEAWGTRKYPSAEPEARKNKAPRLRPLLSAHCPQKGEATIPINGCMAKARPS